MCDLPDTPRGYRCCLSMDSRWKCDLNPVKKWIILSCREVKSDASDVKKEGLLMLQISENCVIYSEPQMFPSSIRATFIPLSIIWIHTDTRAHTDTQSQLFSLSECSSCLLASRWRPKPNSKCTAFHLGLKYDSSSPRKGGERCSNDRALRKKKLWWGSV